MPLLSTTPRAVGLSPPLPMRNEIFQRAGIVLRHSQFSLVAAAPGVGKSLLAENLALSTGVPTLFCSADSDEYTVRQRALAILTGQELSKVEKNLYDETWDAYYAEQLRRTDHIDWCYRSDIDMEFLVRRLKSHEELRGRQPDLIVVDNLGNTVVDQDNEYAELRGTCRELQAIARTTGAHVLALHHVKGAKENGLQPIWLGDLLGNLGKIPECVLGLCRSSERGELTLTVPKNRGGKGNTTHVLPIDYSRASIGGFAW